MFQIEKTQCSVTGQGTFPQSHYIQATFHNSTVQNPFIESAPPLFLHAFYLFCLAANNHRTQYRNGKRYQSPIY